MIYYAIMTIASRFRFDFGSKQTRSGIEEKKESASPTNTKTPVIN